MGRAAHRGQKVHLMNNSTNILMKTLTELAVAFLLALAVAAAGFAPAAQAATSPDEFDRTLLPYLQTNCFRCHNAERQEAEFRVDTLSKNVGTESNPQWLEVMERINSGEMPPETEAKRPTAAESAKAVEWIAAWMKEGEAARMATRARVTYNRLTRDEYVNTVRDLIGVEFDAKDPGSFLEDPEWQGFERLGSVLTLSPSNIEKYLAAAEIILNEAYPEPPAGPRQGQTPPERFGGTKRVIEASQIHERHRERLRELDLLDKVRFEMWPGDIYRDSQLASLPESGVYEISYTLSGLRPPGGRAPRLKVYEEKLDRVLFEQDIVADEDKPITVTFRAHLPKGSPNIHVYNDVPGPSNIPRSGRHSQVPFVSTKLGRTPWQMKLTDEEGLAIYPFLILDSITWRGPILTDEEKQRRNDYMPPEEGSLQQARACLTTLARRAFRRPVLDAEMDSYMNIVQSELEAKETFRDAVKSGMAAILNSKSFLFLAEGDETSNRSTLNDWEIASRLSYLLWSTMPDNELFALAEQGRLRDKAVLAQQFARMITDPRAERFSDSFATQWLRLRKVGIFQPDKKLYPDYYKTLETSMIAETKLFFREVLECGLTLREFLHSDWSVMNELLARHYGIEETFATAQQLTVTAREFMRVALPPTSHRGGLLTQASILSLTSDGVRHRPVHRGVWLSEAIFGKSPPPPPANVDPIPTNPTGPKATLRQKLEAHIHDTRCAACHAKIDHLGLAFENYDAIGRWRTEEVTDGVGENPTVVSSGKFPDGREYQNVVEFKQLLLRDLDAFNHTFVEKLATYGLRRTMSFADREELQKIAAASKAKDYRLQDLVEAFVCSDLFQLR
jgi:mono/diheme cytochrome c family protein